MKRVIVFSTIASFTLPMVTAGLNGAGMTAQAQPASPPTTLSCDETLMTAFHPNANTRVVLAHGFKKGDLLQLQNGPSAQPVGPGPAAPGRGNRAPLVAQADVCVVKLIVGPGYPGPADAPSTSQGIGIEIWLPARGDWNQRLRVMGGGGFAGGPVTSSPTQLAGLRFAADLGGYVVASTDTGHTAMDGSFLVTPEGKINTVLWQDFAERGVHEMAVVTRMLAEQYYGKSVKYAYFDGCSTGGRQGLKEAQVHPEDFDGILAGAPANHWTQFITSELYPQIVMQQDLGKTISAQKLNLASAAAVSSCDTKLNGEHDGFISYPESCDYDPAKDARVLCATSGGSNTTASCLTPAEATAINKIWYGQTRDGTVPSPSRSNGYTTNLAANQVWFGLTRGTRLTDLTGSDAAGAPQPFVIASDLVALNLQNPSLAAPTFVNATGNGKSAWTTLRYADLARSADQGKALQASFGNIDTDNPDLSRFKARHGKLLQYHGLADSLIAPEGSINYYGTVVQALGGYGNVKDFYRFYEIPGMGHCQGIGTVNGMEGVSPPATPPLPAPNQLFDQLVAWVEQDKAPQEIVLADPRSNVSRPICDYPKKITYQGGDRRAAASYSCKD